MAETSAAFPGAAGEGECHVRESFGPRDCLRDKCCWVLTSLLIILVAVVGHVVRTGETSPVSIGIKMLDGGLRRLNLGPSEDAHGPDPNTTTSAPPTDDGGGRGRERRRQLQGVIRNQEALADELDRRRNQIRRED
jgi:hypothetical protein